ncbi:hypothetical protein CUJ83_00230 [Methanocella sp. CWC-04]|uniref:Uncharacterized protein n=2 Tax=Methanooceanicella nereidis TaxID=2052831 RepID=A0AAP2RCB2_9EURY|nr:hypothetical protein [Methanocella sp. CWC-04]
MADRTNPGSGELEMKSWLKKLKENQERKREERLRRYNDLVSKFIILLIAVCIVCLIAVMALFVQNDQLKKENDKLFLENGTNYNMTMLQIEYLESENKKLKDFILYNRTPNVEHTLIIDPDNPKVSKIIFTTNKVRVEFVDGKVEERHFLDYTLNI